MVTEIAIGILVVLFTARMVLAPYWISQDQDAKSQAEESRLKQQLAEAQQKRDYRRIADELAQLHQQCLQLLMREVHCKDDYISWKEEIEDWYERSQAEIQGSLGLSEMELFRTSGGSRFVLSVQPLMEDTNKICSFFTTDNIACV